MRLHLLAASVVLVLIGCGTAPGGGTGGGSGGSGGSGGGTATGGGSGGGAAGGTAGGAAGGTAGGAAGGTAGGAAGGSAGGAAGGTAGGAAGGAAGGTAGGAAGGTAGGAAGGSAGGAAGGSAGGAAGGTAGGAAGGSAGGSGGGVATVVYVQDIQDGTIAMNAIVTVTNVFVTAAKGGVGVNTTYYVQEPQGVTTTGHVYPLFAGVNVFATAVQSTTFLSVGDCVTVTGQVKEFNQVTELTNPVFTVNTVTACGTFPTAFVIPSTAPMVSYADASQGASTTTPGAQCEALEGVLVQLDNVRAATAPDSFLEFYVAQQSNPMGPVIAIDDFFYATPGVTIGTNFTRITGVFTQFVNFKIQPRSASDVVP